MNFETEKKTSKKEAKRNIENCVGRIFFDVAPFLVDLTDRECLMIQKRIEKTVKEMLKKD